MLKKLLSFTLASSMLLASAQLISNEPVAQSEDCQEALAIAQDAQNTAQNAFMRADDAHWQINYAKTQAQAAIEAAKKETEWAKIDAAAARSEAQTAQKHSRQLAHAVLGLAVASVGLIEVGLCAVRLNSNPTSTMDNVCLGLTTAVLGILAAAPVEYEDRNTNALNYFTKTLALLGVFTSGCVMGENFGAKTAITTIL